MRSSLWLPVLALCVGCGQKVDHPELADGCDPATMVCTPKPPNSGSNGDGEGGADSGSEEETGTISGLVVAYSDDFFDQGLAFTGEADVSAVGRDGARVEAPYDGMAFELKDVLKDPGNWFLVEPEEGQGVLPTITPVDTRVAKADGYSIGLASEQVVDSLFVLAGAERATSRAQIVVTVVDDQGRSIPGVLASLSAEVVAYREAGGWITGDTGTDDSGMIFLGNVQASSALSKATIIFSGAVTARVELRTRAGAVTVATAIVSPP